MAALIVVTCLLTGCGPEDEASEAPAADTTNPATSGTPATAVPSAPKTVTTLSAAQDPYNGLIVPKLAGIPACDAGMALLRKKGFDMTKVLTVTRRILETYFQVQCDYLRGNYQTAKTTMDAFWVEYPRDSPYWDWTMWKEMQDSGIDFGGPVGGKSLNLLSEAVDWRVKQQMAGAPTPHPRPLVLGVVMPAASKGIIPANVDEMKAGTGTMTTFNLDPELVKDNYQFIQTSWWLLGEYLLAASDGRLQIAIKPIRLPVTLPIAIHYTNGGLNIESAFALGSTIPVSAIQDVDMWMYLYPSIGQKLYRSYNLPPIGGGGGGMILDRPFFGSSDIGYLARPVPLPADLAAEPTSRLLKTPEEQMLGLPNWLHHEWFHALAQMFPQYNLEAKSHQWFDPANWPSDFVHGAEEVYFIQAVSKRFVKGKDGYDGFASVLTRRTPLASELYPVTIDSMLGRYTEAPLSTPDAVSPYFRGVLQRKAGMSSRLSWVNDAGTGFDFDPKLDAQGHLQSARMLTPTGGEVNLKFGRNVDGTFTTSIEQLLTDRTLNRVR